MAVAAKKRGKPGRSVLGAERLPALKANDDPRSLIKADFPGLAADIRVPQKDWTVCWDDNLGHPHQHECHLEKLAYDYVQDIRNTRNNLQQHWMDYRRGVFRNLCIKNPFGVVVARFDLAKEEREAMKTSA